MLAVVLAASAGCGPKGPPDVVLIVIDTLRADRLGCYGYDANTSPHIDEFARGALLFENAIAHASDTRLSCSALMTGYLPHETGVMEKRALPEDAYTLAERLSERGYHTAAVVSNYVLREGVGFEQGFIEFDSVMEQREINRDWPERTAVPTTDRAIEVLDEAREEPLFLWVHYQDPHGPYTPPEDALLPLEPGRSGRPLRVNPTVSGQGGIPSYQVLGQHQESTYYEQRYEAEIRHVDREVGRLIDALKQRGNYGNTLVILTSDHGEAMGEHDYYFAHGEHLYQHQIHVPMILRHGRQLRGRRSAPVQLVDVVPTILETLGDPADPAFRGISLRRWKDERTILSEVNLRAPKQLSKFSLVQGKLKVIWTPLANDIQLFDLDTDPTELRSLARDPEYKDQVKDMLFEAARMRDENRLAVKPDAQPHQPTEEELEKLRSLGYID